MIDEFIHRRSSLHPKDELDILEKLHIQTVTLEDETYPSLLKQIYDPPVILFVQGTIPQQTDRLLAVVGTRHPSTYGKQVVTTLVKELTMEGFVIVSGLAYGIDALAHKITCQNQGKTIAVLGSGIDRENLYPKEHDKLADEIIKIGGALLSEFAPGTSARKHFFPFRNRIIAGLCQATLIIEAAQKSGSLITAKSALESNRDVFAIPGSIYSPLSLGPHNLIKMGAQLVTSSLDILCALGMEKREEKKKEPCFLPEPENPIQAKIFSLLSSDPVHVDEIKQSTSLDLSLITNALTLMEMNGLVRHLGGMYYVKG
jgi:DNA processing protein